MFSKAGLTKHACVQKPNREQVRDPEEEAFVVQTYCFLFFAIREPFLPYSELVRDSISGHNGVFNYKTRF